MHLRTFILLPLLACLVGGAHAGPADNECHLSDQQFANAVSTLREWSKVHAFYKAHFPPCPDDGMFAEGYSELIVRTLATNWSNLSQLRFSANRDANFKSFVLRHIDATANEADLRAILANAKSQCPRGCKALCAEIRKASLKAINELR